jgi:3-oxoacyl-[acyl-carrier protein] reductase
MIKDSVLITGGSGGIGTSLIEKLNNNNIKVINIDKYIDRQLYSNENFIELDFTSLHDNFNWLETQLKSYHISNFIHCAGYGGPFIPITEVSLLDWSKIFSINLDSAFYLLKILLPKWKSQNYGRFLGIASSLSIKGAENSVAYSSAKHALVGLAKSIGIEWGRFGITSNCLSPGYVDTKMGVQEGGVSDHRKKILSMTPSNKIAETDEITRVALFMLEEESTYINCSNWTVDGGITAF